MNETRDKIIIAVVVVVVLFFLIKGAVTKRGTVQANIAYENPYFPLSPNYLKGEYAKKKIHPSYVINLLTQKELNDRVKQLYTAKGYFKDTDEQAFAGLNVPYKSQVSQIAERFEKTYNRDLSSYLKGFLDESNFNALILRIEKLK